MLHFLNLSQLSIIETTVSDARKEATFCSFFLIFFEGNFFLESKEEANFKWIFVVQGEIIEKLLPNVLIFRNSFEERNGFEFPAISCASTSSVAHPSPCYNPTSDGLHLALLNEIDSPNYGILIEDFS